MLAKRIISCLDIKDGRTVKGVNFVDLRDAGDPVELAVTYMNQGADELVFLDITATHEKRKTLSELVLRISEKLAIPFTVGGGISSVDDVRILLGNGADKISINSSAVKRPELISEIASTFGNQCVVVAVDGKKINGQWKVFLNGGRIETDLLLKDWVTEAEKRGAGEILFTSMDHDGTKNGFANEILSELNELVSVPVIASGGAGKMNDFKDAFLIGKADAALAASVFHFGEIKIPELKEHLFKNGISVRL
jgi:cyclase